MVVLILENAPQSLRGELSRFLIEPKANVFVGKISALVREKLWEHCIKQRDAPSLIMIWSDANEQGFSIKTYGDTTRIIRDYEGLSLVSLRDDSHAKRVRIVVEKAGLNQTET